MDKLDRLHELMELLNEKIDMGLSGPFKQELKEIEIEYAKLKKELTDEIIRVHK